MFILLPNNILKVFVIQYHLANIHEQELKKQTPYYIQNASRDPIYTTIFVHDVHDPYFHKRFQIERLK